MTRPADELRAAADGLRDLATTATEAPWRRWRDQERIPGWDGLLMVGDSTEPTEDDDGNPIAKLYTESDAEYIAAMHPGVGLAIAHWLYSWTGIDVAEDAAMPEDLRHALTVARQILGATKPVPAAPEEPAPAAARSEATIIRKAAEWLRTEYPGPDLDQHIRRAADALDRLAETKG